MDASLSGGLIVATEAMAESADEGDHLSDVTGPHKPLLSVDEQIAHLKRKGVSFELCGEDTARQVLSESSYFFRLAAYRVLFPKRVGGQHDGEYAGLDFGHLVDLAEIDRELRGLLLPMSLAVENASKTELMHRVMACGDENGYSIFSDYLASLSHGERNRRRGEIKRLENDAYLGQLVARYPIEKMPVWVFLELSSFGAFSNFYLFCADRWGDSAMRRDHYLLRCSGSLRNATAHSSAILNGFGGKDGDFGIRIPQEVAIALGKIGVNKRARRSKMHSLRILQIVMLTYAFRRFAIGGAREFAHPSWQLLKKRVARHGSWYAGNTILRSSYDFLCRVFDNWLK